MLAVKCCGERPACTRCLRKDEICIYDAAEGVSRQQDLQTRLHSVEAGLGQTRGFIHNLQHSSNRDAAILLKRLRLGEDVAELANAATRRPVRYLPILKVYQPAMLTLEGGHLRLTTRMTTVCSHKPWLLSRSKRDQHYNPTYQSTLLPINLGKPQACCLSLSTKVDRSLPSMSLRITQAIQRTRQCIPRRGTTVPPKWAKMRGTHRGANCHS
jgi:hypothetical protein